MSTQTGLPQLTPSDTGSSSAAASPSNTASNGNTRNSNPATNTGTTNTASTSASRGSGSASASGASSVLPGLGTASSSSQSISVITGAPSLSTASQGNGPILSLTGLPTLSGAFSYPPASVPPTSNAPYMKTSQLPQNFVFIVVGGVLAFILLMVVLWRSLTAWSINKSFKKDSAALYTPLPDIKKKPTKSDTMNMADLSGGKLPKSFNSVPSLFFSPTAEVARQSMIRPQSQHMPSGHYRDASKGSGM